MEGSLDDKKSCRFTQRHSSAHNNLSNSNPKSRTHPCRSDPGAIRHVMLENAANYQKDWLQRRILSAGLADGLLSVEGQRWKAQRHALAPLFSRKAVLAFSISMVASAQILMMNNPHGNSESRNQPKLITGCTRLVSLKDPPKIWASNSSNPGPVSALVLSNNFCFPVGIHGEPNI